MRCTDGSLCVYVRLVGKELASYIEQQAGWKLADGSVQVPANPDNEVKATVIREDLQLDREFALHANV